MIEYEEASRVVIEQIERESREARPAAGDPKAVYRLLKASRALAGLLKEIPAKRLVSQPLSEAHIERIRYVAELFADVSNTDAPEWLQADAHRWYVSLQMLDH